VSGGFRLIHGGRSDETPPGLLIVGAAEIATLAGGVRAGPDQGDVDRLRADPATGPDAPDAPVVACWDGRIVAVGPRADVEAIVEADGLPLARFARVDARGGGVTTVEAKSGYGLDLETEIRLVDAAFRLGTEGPIDVVPTYLGAHAVAPEFRARPAGPEAYVRSVIEEQLPGIAAHGRARFCDVFCEDGVFSADQSRRILVAAAAYGMGVRLHADELAPSGGAELAAELGAASADHLATPSDAGIAALAAAADAGEPVVATLLPVTTWFLMKEHHAPARTFIERGVPVAIGTDFNPGTSPTASLPLAMTAACVGLRMTPDEVLSAVTINAAQALGLADEIGSIEPGKSADLTVWRVPTTAQIPYWPAADLVRTVIKRGRVVLDRS
jgi:imidazolonepropionase